VTIPPCPRSPNEGFIGDFGGELEVSVEDYPNGSRTVYVLKTATERLSLHFAANPPGHFLAGGYVHVRGTLTDGVLAVARGDTGVETLALGSISTDTSITATATSSVWPNTFGAQKTLVILANFQDSPTQPWTLDQVRSLVFGTVSNFYWENSYQQTWLTGDVVGWYTIPLSSTTCNNLDIASNARLAASAAGVNLSAYNRYVYMFPSTTSCTWAGLSSISAYPSEAWINGY